MFVYEQGFLYELLILSFFVLFIFLLLFYISLKL